MVDHFNNLAEIVGAENLLRDTESLSHFGTDALKLYQPKPSAVVRPGSTAEVAALVRYAIDNGIALVPSGGRTGLSGGATATANEIIVSMVRMNQILDIDKVSRTITCQAGVVTQQLQEFAEAHGLYYPVDLASGGSSQIGGNIATNAGGTKVIRYGMTRQWVLGLTVVTGTGEVLELNKGLGKNNTGYDYRHLFIGSEGTLGIVTEATLQLTRAPKALEVMVLGVNSMAAVAEVFYRFQDSIDLTAFEFFSDAALEKVVAHQGVRRPFDSNANLYALIEFESRNENDAQVALQVFEFCVAKGWVTDGVMSQSNQQSVDLWRLREDISATLAQWSPYKNDLSVTVSQIPSFLTRIAQRLKQDCPEFEVIFYGHLGDGNVHVNILKPDSWDAEDFKARCDRISEAVFDIVSAYRGSISAEHGIGLLKKRYLSHTRSASEIEMMRNIKSIFDPHGILNPGKIFDQKAA